MGFLLMLLVFNVFQRSTPAKVDRVFRRGQLVSSALLSLAHGSNDAQKTMGIIVGLLASGPVQAAFAGRTGILSNFYIARPDVTPPLWVEALAYLAISLGTLFGGWRIVHTMGSRITRLRPVGGFCAETGGGIVILVASRFGIPVSTTHTITGSIVGVGATNRLIGGAVGARRAYRLGVGAHDPRVGVHGGARVLDSARGGAIPFARISVVSSRLPPTALFINRELSWLEFNARVLHEATDSRTRLLERVKFLSDLQHEPRRVLHGSRRRPAAKGGAGCGAVSAGRPHTGRAARGDPPARDRAARACATSVSIASCSPRLAGHGVVLKRMAELTPPEWMTVDEFFESQVFPVLTPLAVDPGHPFPYISNLSLSLAVELRDPASGGEPSTSRA